MKNKNKVIILVGPSLSGKSTFQRTNFLDEYVVLENDKIRKEYNLGYEKEDHQKFDKIFSDILKKRLKENIDIVIDGLNLTKKLRVHLYKMIKSENPNYMVEVKIFLCPIEELVNRSVIRNKEIEMQISEKLIIHQLKGFSLPKEGLDCDHVSYEVTKTFSYEDVLNIEQRNRYLEHDSTFHLESVYTHIQMVIDSAKKNTKYKDELLEIAKWHDLGKFYAKEQNYACSMFAGHSNISSYLYLCYVKSNGIIDYEEILNSIFDHMRSHEYTQVLKELEYYKQNINNKDNLLTYKFRILSTNKIRILSNDLKSLDNYFKEICEKLFVSKLTYEFTKLDSKSRIKSPVSYKMIKVDGENLRYYYLEEQDYDKIIEDSILEYNHILSSKDIEVIKGDFNNQLQLVGKAYYRNGKLYEGEI